MEKYELKALKFAERYGIIDYKVKNNLMTYKETFASEGTYKATVNLDTMEEKRRKVR